MRQQGDDLFAGPNLDNGLSESDLRLELVYSPQGKASVARLALVLSISATAHSPLEEGCEVLGFSAGVRQATVFRSHPVRGSLFDFYCVKNSSRHRSVTS